MHCRVVAFNVLKYHERSNFTNHIHRAYCIEKKKESLAVPSLVKTRVFFMFLYAGM
jgi:hypothetical protein